MYYIIVTLLIVVSVFAIHRNNDANKYRQLWLNNKKDA